MNTATTERPTITMHAVDSSQIAAIGHCPATETLAIEFIGKAGPGSLYHYANFTAAEYAAFVSAQSIGKHFYAHIKPHADKHPYRKIEAVPAPAAAAMTKESLAAQLNGRKYGDEIGLFTEALAKLAGLLVIFGASDDLMEFRGIEHDEVGAPGTALIDAKGLLPNRDSIDDDETLKDFFARQPGARTVEALWTKEEDFSWTFKTDVPHATFIILDDDLPYCRGIVIDVADLGAVA
ncbi:MAG: KTSC domain-containing protein [Pseudomonadota bacterium]